MWASALPPLPPLLLLLSAALLSLPAGVSSFAAPALFSRCAQDVSPRRHQSALQSLQNLGVVSCSDEPRRRAAALQSSLLPESMTKGDAAVGCSDASPETAAMLQSSRRREMLQSVLAAPLVLTSQSASASEKPPPIIPLVTTARRLRAVPTFTIVDGNGIPFHTYDKDSAGGFGYFFTSYTSAEYVLDDAKKAFAKAKSEAAKKKEEGTEGAIGEDGTGDVPDAWGEAQIVTLPLDVVMQLSVKTTESVAQNGKGKKFKTYYQVIPETSDLNAALKIENSQRYSERGRVPLFYVEGMTVPSPEGDWAEATPVYFRIKDLKAEWEKQYPGSELPPVKVRELNETFRAMIRPGGKDESVRSMVFVPIPESVEKAKAVGRSYKLGEIILTK